MKNEYILKKSIMKKYIIILLFGFSLNSYCQTAGNGVIDIEGNTYNSVIIGTQEWQKENLNVSKYTDGTVIPMVTDQIAWKNLTTGAWCWYNNNSSGGSFWGKLYNWYAVAGIYDAASLANPALRKQLAPLGWHIPSFTEWMTISDYLGGFEVAGGKMKLITPNWKSPNTGASNFSGFSGLPAGYRTNSGFCCISSNLGPIIGEDAMFWSKTEISSGIARAQKLGYADSYLEGRNNSSFYGCSVRCIKGVVLNNQSFNNIFFKIYPNPANSILNLSVNDGIVIDKITIVDIEGKVIFEQTENLSVINVEKLAKGVYILTVFTGDKKYREKFIKE
jgi:uncharacterized protein (TIGR02145 family)